MQLAKTMGAIERLRAARVPFISVMSDPTTGGTFASFAVAGDVNLAEPKATIRFAGDRVSSGTIGEALPEGYNTAEFQLDHGFVDRIVPRARLRDEIIALCALLIAPSPNAQPEPTRSAFRPGSILSAIQGALSADSDGGASQGEGSTNG
jgi:acetyl-CoA carboxylase carboxyl transferase subunit beta